MLTIFMVESCKKIHLPLSEFEMVDVELTTILKTENDSENSFALEVDLDYTDALQDMQKNFPVAPTKRKIFRNMLSDYQMGLLDQTDNRHVTAPKPVLKIFAKKNYIVHYIILKLYVDLCLKVTIIQRVIQFKQEYWLKPYINLNTRKRTLSKNKLEETFYRLMNNCC